MIQHVPFLVQQAKPRPHLLINTQLFHRDGVHLSFPVLLDDAVVNIEIDQSENICGHRSPALDAQLP